MATEKVVPITGSENRDVHCKDNGQVDNPTVHVNRGAGDQVTWFSHTKALIVFTSKDGSPFAEATFHVPAEGSVSSGQAKPTAETDKPYKYTVVAEHGVNDPTVIIHN